MKKILHITDLHLNNFNSENEFLREGYYQEYIDKLYDEVSITDEIKEVDFLLLSGDFIDIGKIENFPEISKIIDYLCQKFKIKPNSVCCTIGNHDYQWKIQKADLSDSVDLKKPFYEFVLPYNEDIINQEDYYTFKKLDTDIFYLSLDSTWKSIDGKPGIFNIHEEDKLINDLRKHINQNSTLLIGCHFPIISYSNNFLAMEEVNWHENHIWIKGATLRDRVKNLNAKNTIWFHGDVHASDQSIIENETFILTSKFAANLSISEIPRQAVMLLLNDCGLEKITYNYIFDTHKQHPNLGKWVSSKSQQIRAFKQQEETKDSIISSPNSLKLIDDEIQSTILENISVENLFQFGRFKTSENITSLGWVDINKLMSNKYLLGRISEKGFIHIDQIVKSNSDKVLFVGLEIIGSILASQLSVRFNVKNEIFPIRGKHKYYSSEETNDSKILESIIHFEEVVIFIDIISSGSTINDLIKQFNDKNKELKIHVISIISNDLKTKISILPYTSSYATFCSTLKIPIIADEDLPNENIFKSTLNFVD